mmetsp:Transcript_6638/g.16594  ORF Transcript_6638/g.16594 Transcript_6638/m.16594 type:complete len:256 (-) Transcript_6638:769-1536(-)
MTLLILPFSTSKKWQSWASAASNTKMRTNKSKPNLADFFTTCSTSSSSKRDPILPDISSIELRSRSENTSKDTSSSLSVVSDCSFFTATSVAHCEVQRIMEVTHKRCTTSTSSPPSFDPATVDSSRAFACSTSSNIRTGLSGFASLFSREATMAAISFCSTRTNTDTAKSVSSTRSPAFTCVSSLHFAIISPAASHNFEKRATSSSNIFDIDWKKLLSFTATSKLLILADTLTSTTRVSKSSKVGSTSCSLFAAD